MRFLTALFFSGLLGAQSLTFPGPGSPAAAGGGCSLSYVTNLVLWVKADAGLTCTSGCSGTHTVTAWADQSGSGNNLTTSSSALTYAAADINGLPAVAFPGYSGGFGPSSFSLTSGITASSITIFAVAKDITGFQRGAIISGPTNSLEYFLNDSSSGKLQGANATFAALLITGTAAANSGYHQVNFTGVSGTSQVVRQNRTADGSASAATSFVGAALTKIGYNAQAGIGGCTDSNTCDSMIGAIAELLVYNAALSGGNNTTVENYLNCRYGL